jgi:hypothetical protein
VRRFALALRTSVPMTRVLGSRTVLGSWLLRKLVLGWQRALVDWEPLSRSARLTVPVPQLTVSRLGRLMNRSAPSTALVLDSLVPWPAPAMDLPGPSWWPAMRLLGMPVPASGRDSV